jgi:hypothetical protein
MHIKIGWKKKRYVGLALSKWYWPNNFAHFVEVSKRHNKVEHLI